MSSSAKQIEELEAKLEKQMLVHSSDMERIFISEKQISTLKEEHSKIVTEKSARIADLEERLQKRLAETKEEESKHLAELEHVEETVASLNAAHSNAMAEKDSKIADLAVIEEENEKMNMTQSQHVEEMRRLSQDASRKEDINSLSEYNRWQAKARTSVKKMRKSKDY